MFNRLYIAWRYVCHNKIKTGTLVACVTLISFVPLSLELLLDESQRQLMSRAASTPLVIGSKGSSLDLVMNTLYFDDEVPEPVTMAAVDRVMDSELALPIPMYVRFRARGYPIVATTLDYFAFRALEVADGRMLAVLGECIVGAGVADKMGIAPGDSLVSSPENLFDLTGVYPLKMRVAGVLKRTHTSDDRAIFTDLKTAWVIQGLVHGHADVTKITDETLILKKTETNVAATAKLFHFQEITPENIGTFHFHGNESRYPISAVIVVPHDAKSGTILRGKYLDKGERHQIVKPNEVIDGLLQTIFRIKNIMDAVILVVATATVLAVVLVFALSFRLRQREIQTIFKLGCSRSTIASLVGAEIGIIVCISGVLCMITVFAMHQFSDELVRTLFIG